MDKQTTANTIWTRAYELKDTDLTTEDCDELAEAVIAAARRELPEDWAAMLTAATECILTRGGYNRYDYPNVYSPEHSRYIAATKEAAAILEAADAVELLTRIAELETHEEEVSVFAENCQHVVDTMKARIAELEAELENLNGVVCGAEERAQRAESDRDALLVNQGITLERLAALPVDERSRRVRDESTGLANMYIARSERLSERLGDEKHCACVPALRARIAELEAELVKVRESAHENFVYLENLAEQKRTEAR